MKKWLLSSILVVAIAALAACGGGGNDNGENPEGLLGDGKLTVGTTAGVQEQLVEKVQELAAEQDLEIEIKTFTDYPIVNEALAQGELDINVFQHEPYLNEFKEDRNLDLIKVANTVNFPMGVYSNKIDDISKLEKGAKIGLPNDPTNGGRALLLFEQAGLIKLKEDAGVTAGLNDIEENKNDYEFVELEAAQIPRQLDELDAAAINSNYAMEAGYIPAEDSIFIEPKDSPWVNIVAARTENKDDEAIKQFVDLYQSEEMEKFIEEELQGSVIPGW
ncbi:MetQ/NlpA family ABC transporter substrate-binding protein [Siminovitchia sediminis]|uniref:Lipoprotein n=1 Tax=Siminovitchia sediminis TaxID=1274353 RepID=A0ABW4KGB0_9BACI